MPNVLLFLLLILICQPVLAQELIKGMTMKDVLSSKDWGVPKRKMDYETSRRERWYYDGDRFIDFKEGVVSSWKSSQTLSILPDVENLPIDIEPESTGEADDPGTSVGAFLREVEKEGSDDDGESGGTAPRRAPRRR